MHCMVCCKCCYMRYAYSSGVAIFPSAKPHLFHNDIPQLQDDLLSLLAQDQCRELGIHQSTGPPHQLGEGRRLRDKVIPLQPRVQYSEQCLWTCRKERETGVILSRH